MQGKIIKERILSDNWGKYSEYTVEYTKSDGSTEIHHREVHDAGDGASILLYNKAKRTVVLIKQYRLPTQINGNPSGVIIESVAGLVESDEDHRDTIIREVKEETGLEANEVTFLFSAYATPGAKTEKIYFYIGSYDEEVTMNRPFGVAQEHEEIEVLELPFDEAYEGISNGKIKDAKTIILLQYARLHIFTS